MQNNFGYISDKLGDKDIFIKSLGIDNEGVFLYFYHEPTDAASSGVWIPKIVGKEGDESESGERFEKIKALCMDFWKTAYIYNWVKPPCQKPFENE